MSEHMGANLSLYDKGYNEKNPNEKRFIRGKKPTGEVEEVTRHVGQPEYLGFTYFIYLVFEILMIIG